MVSLSIATFQASHVVRPKLGTVQLDRMAPAARADRLVTAVTVLSRIDFRT
jgi:hypothetical protein